MTRETPNTVNSSPEDTRTPEDRRREYLERLERATRALTERVRRAERLTADDYAVQINARD